MPEIYIYYRIDLTHQEAYETQLRAMQARLTCSTGAIGRLLRSCSDSAMRMEIYSGVGDAEAFIEALELAVSRFEIDLFLASGERRHVECFTD